MPGDPPEAPDEGTPEPGAAEPKRLRRSHLLRREAFVDRYLLATRLSMNLEDRARFAGVASSTVRAWQVQANDAKGEGETSETNEYIEFFEKVEGVEMERMGRNLAKANELAHNANNWNALRFLLGRDGYYDLNVNRIEGPDGGPVILQFDKQDEDA